MNDLTLIRGIVAATTLVGLGATGLFLWDEPAPRKRKAFSKDERWEVWKRWIGNKTEGKCYVCERTIHFTDFDVAHNIARANGGSNSPANLRPTCRQCNRAMGTKSIEVYKRWLKGSATRTNAGKNKATTAKTKIKKPVRRKRSEPNWPW